MKEVRPTSLFVFLWRRNATPNKRTPPQFRKSRGDPSGLHISLNYYTPLSPFFFPVFFLAFLQGKFRWWGKRLERKRYSQLAPKTYVSALHRGRGAMFAFLLGSGPSLVCYAYGQPFQPATSQQRQASAP